MVRFTFCCTEWPHSHSLSLTKCSPNISGQYSWSCSSSYCCWWWSPTHCKVFQGVTHHVRMNATSPCSAQWTVRACTISYLRQTLQSDVYKLFWYHHSCPCGSVLWPVFIADQNCSPNIPDKHSHTPLYFAALGGHLCIMKYLIDEQGCDPSCLDQSPLHCAAHNGQLDIVKFFTLKKCCNPD